MRETVVFFAIYALLADWALSSRRQAGVPAPIVNYTQATAACNSATGDGTEHRWADFDDDQLPTGEWLSHDYSASFASLPPPYTTPVRLVNSTDFTMPLFGVENVSLYVNSDGFVSVSPNSMCAPSIGYCNSEADGFYFFNGNRDKQGDWPMIALYSEDFNSFRGPTQTVPRIRSRDLYEVANDTGSLIGVELEYIRLPLDNSQLLLADSELSARLRLFRNGTIVMKYRHVPATQRDPPPSVGATYTTGALGSTPSVVAPEVPTAANGVCAIKLDPRRDDHCRSRTSCESCVDQTFAEDITCAWCPAQQRCTDLRVIAETCVGYQDATTRVSLCNRSNARIGIRELQARQRFYRVEYVRYDPRDTLDNELDAAATRVTRVPMISSSVALPNVVTLPFSVPIFDFPQEARGMISGTSAQRRSSRIALIGSGPSIRFLLDDDDDDLRPVCSYGQYKQTNGEPQSNCDQMFSMPYDIRPLSSIQFSSHPDRPARTYLLNGGGPLCARARQHRSTTECPDAFVVELRGIIYTDRTPTWTFSSTDHTEFAMTVRVAIWADGAVSIHPHHLTEVGGFIPVLVDSPTAAYPMPETSFYGRASAVEPPTVLSQHVVPGSTITFEPSFGCPDCNSNGYCNTSSLTCECINNRVGERCDRCLSGFFGPNCERCPSCSNGGTCDDGTDGSGLCNCVGAWRGDSCDIRCDDLAPGESGECIPRCNSNGGRCACGKCECRTQYGWHGPTCGEWTDPCSQYTLDGCGTCVGQQLTFGSIRCDYCLANSECMMSTTQSQLLRLIPFGANRRFCTLGFVPQGQTRRCPVFDYNRAGPKDNTVMTNVFVAGFLIFAFTAVTVIFSLCRIQARPDLGNILLRRAVLSLPNHRRYGGRFAGTRTVVALELEDMPRMGREKLVHAVPLKQIDIELLHNYQFARARGDAVDIVAATEALGTDHLRYRHDAEKQALIKVTADDERRRRRTVREQRRREREERLGRRETRAERRVRRQEAREAAEAQREAIINAMGVFDRENEAAVGVILAEEVSSDTNTDEFDSIPASPLQHPGGAAAAGPQRQPRVVVENTDRRAVDPVPPPAAAVHSASHTPRDDALVGGFSPEDGSLPEGRPSHHQHQRQESGEPEPTSPREGEVDTAADTPAVAKT